MADLNEILAFIKVVENQSFTGAAKSLGLPKSTISRKVALLEERLGVRLLQRTTRKLKLTDSGSAFYEHCSRGLNEIEEAEHAVMLYQQIPVGTLRITAPVEFGTNPLFISIVTEFLRDNPNVTLDVELSGRIVDLIEEGFDLAIRAGQLLQNSSLIARKLAAVSHQLYVSPKYIKSNGPIKQPKDLQNHNCILFSPAQSHTWKMSRLTEVENINVQGNLHNNSILFQRDAAVAGLGIANLPQFLCVGELNRGQLQTVLDNWQLDGSSIYAVYPTRKHLSPKLRVFLNLLIERFRSASEWT